MLLVQIYTNILQTGQIEESNGFINTAAITKIFSSML